ncbi:hypothetical protein A0256_02440 [Mucilaginibacter sp. PAMC 26640]|nr:hypothetical protein A0256_02440 [Mucilaginibacter sp. PAMC 26640]
MKEEDKNDIDSLFRNGFSNAGENALPTNEDWAAMERLLEGGTQKSLFLQRLPIIMSGIAAMLLLLLGWLFFKPGGQEISTKMQQVKVKPIIKKDTGTYGQRVQLLTQSTKIKPLSATMKKANSEIGRSRNSKSFFTLSTVAAGRTTTGNVPGNHNYAGESTTIAMQDTAMQNGNSTVNTVDTIATQNIAASTDRDTNQPVIASAEAPAAKIKKTNTASRFRPTFAVSVLASSDLNSVQSFSQNKLGTSAGLGLTIGLSKKWSVTTGAFYADKPYMIPFSGYKTSFKFSTNPLTVSANCIVLDIPVNVGYQVYHQNRNKLSLGAGLSSYFMLRENYTFNYPGTYGGSAYTSNYDIRNKNRHLFGVANINATYQRQINSRFDLGIQPYLKLPLTDIGYGQVNLKSAGVAVGIIWNLNTNTKP